MKTRIAVILTVLLLASANLLGVLGEAPDALAQGDADTERTLSDFPDLTDYREWNELTNGPNLVSAWLWTRCIAPTPQIEAAFRAQHGPHTQYFIRVYGNEGAAGLDPTADSFQLPAGTILVKEKHSDDDGRPEAVAIMIRADTVADPTAEPWEFLYFDGPELRFQPTAAAGCGDCHRGRSDHDGVFGSYLTRGLNP